MDDYKIILKKYFGYDDFRPYQLEIIKHILEDKKDCSAVMATGAGKSLIYFFTGVYSGKIALVISPLIALMNDQLMKLKELKIPACCLNSTVGNKVKLKKEILENKYRIVYTTPEFIVKQETFIQELCLNNLLAGLFCDESHSISAYGFDFREAYRKLNCLKEWIMSVEDADPVPIVALTATATKKVQQDITAVLKLDDPIVIRSSFDRPNLMIKVRPKSGNPMTDILPLLKDEEQCIIYCQTRAMTDEIAEELTQKGVSCLGYHAGLSTDTREEVHKKFVDKKVSVICATIAFGMGIDATIRKVIHYGTPKNLESMYQEIGRAGRDGKLAHCYLFYGMSDMNTNNYFINQITNIAYRNNQIQLGLVMKNYIFTSQCRRKYILEYFGEKYAKDNCGACDNCLTKKTLKTQNFAKEAALLFQVANLTGNAFGGTMLIQILRGANNKKISPANKKSKLYGAGKDQSEKFWKMVLMLLVNDGYFKEKPISRGHGFTLAMTPKATKWLTDYKLDSKTVLNLVIPEDFENVDKKTVKKAVVKTAPKKSILTLDTSL
ncbi:DEAD/SNF2-like helicase [Klosneuvirus KNV1]|uniref:DEAD/SNF2-like helicase n=1 Tax=Klosneuvirus KNV1 TaxID=1977640 RepID=A0A1V0SJN9_9VIRU|nr:DEAD/SNF2-like helicase [Klosneuvirus KNV1]